MILFTQSRAVLHKYLNDELKLLCYNFSLRLYRIPGEFHDFSMFIEIPEYSSFSRCVADLTYDHKLGQVEKSISLVKMSFQKFY